MNSKTDSKKVIPWLLLGSRLVLFLLFQSVVALLLNSWEASQKYWLLTASLTNGLSIIFLILLFRKENIRFIDYFRFKRSTFPKDLLIFIVLTILVVPTTIFPNKFLSLWIWENEEIPFNMMFQPIENWLSYILLLIFPISIAFAELATYFIYVMPRLERQLNSTLFSVILPVLFLSIQHCTLPFIPDTKFIIYRGLVFLPFAIIIGLSIRFRPTLFPYFVILHGIMDFGAAALFLSI